jgi:hypothetical protein
MGGGPASRQALGDRCLRSPSHFGASRAAERWRYDELRWPSSPVLRAFADHLVIDDRDLAQVNVYSAAEEVIAHIAATEPRQPRVAGPRG